MRDRSEGQADLKSVDERGAGVVDADHAEKDAEEDDEAVVCDGAPLHRVPLELQMEVAWPDERQHGASEWADEAHQYAKMGYEDRHQDGEYDHADAPSQTPDFELAVHRPDGREDRLRSAAEEGALQELARGVVRQWVRKHGLYYQAEIHQALEAGRM